MPNANPSPFFVVFDTSTQARYYGDVHEVLALPPMAAITYEYSRRLFAPSAERTFDELAEDPSRLPLPALLMYGQKRSFQKGSVRDPDEMLSWDDSVFVPTRSATIEAVQRGNQLDPQSDSFSFRLAVKGFIDPAEPAVEALVRALEAANSLPFGDRETQYNWVSLLPDTVVSQAPRLISDTQDRWVQVVDQLVKLPTQFADDVFWRVQEITEAKVRRGAHTKRPVSLRDRPRNRRDKVADWNRDYRLQEDNTYTLTVQTYVPEGLTPKVPGDAKVALVPHDDHAALLKLPAHPRDYRPNAPMHENFSITTDFAIRHRYAGLHLETQCQSRGTSYPPGSMCTLSLDIHKPVLRMLTAIVLLLGGLTLVLVGATIAASNPVKIGIGISGVIVVAIGYFMWTRKIKLGPHGG
ncbi:hypothetical protein H7J87_16270 [Mycolicibacterium wolinskyi]|uniref:Uncharacterized protein n=1 Tax=Mycolicibacterium wolinskyi TaxID=59750 RepID=A0A1X2F7N8_9MYCO|nr:MULTISPECIES: hypothetical protein [Mycolicibacterium]MCV7286882.1 hypothetical protein [Mycolicibacterium wolinskyi]MCV7293863.1 hypothetical protein [Mycolicibacterium goodii]ORX14442.1 hypothetical protein AWC31_24890 [Mycolicibacterium wolinskyi]